MDNIDSSVSNIDASSKVLLKSVVQKLLPSLTAAPESLDWNEIVNNYSIVSKQLDNLWVDMKPEFSMSIVTPKNVFRSEFTIPQLLSTMTAADESECVVQPEPRFSVLSESEESELQKSIRAHNAVIANVVDDFSASIEEFKTGLAQDKVNAKRRKLNS